MCSTGPEAVLGGGASLEISFFLSFFSFPGRQTRFSLSPTVPDQVLHGNTKQHRESVRRGEQLRWTATEHADHSFEMCVSFVPRDSGLTETGVCAEEISLKSRAKRHGGAHETARAHNLISKKVHMESGGAVSEN